MKKFFIFIAIAMVFIMLTSGLAIGRKAADKDPEETGGIITIKPATTEPTGPQEGYFYTVDGAAYTKADLTTLSESTFVYFVEGNTTYFALLVVDKFEGAMSLDFVYRTADFPEYDGFFVTRILQNGGHIRTLDNFDLAGLNGGDYLGLDDYPKSGETAYVCAIFLQLSDCNDPASVLSKFVDNSDFMTNANLNNPETPEGPSADPEATTAPVTEEPAPPQIDVPWPEGPGAE